MKHSLLKQLAVIFLPLCFYCACNQDISPPPIIPVTDSCGNDQPITLRDSVLGTWHRYIWKTEDLSYSSTGLYYATFHFNGALGVYGIAVYNIAQNKTEIFLRGTMKPNWSPNGKYLAFIGGGGGPVYVFDFIRMQETQVTPFSYFGDIEWDNSSEFLYLTRGSAEENKPFPENKGGIFRVRKDGRDFTWITDNYFHPQYIDDTTLVSFTPIGFRLIWYSAGTGKTIKSDSVDGYIGNTIEMRHIQISPNKKYIVFDRYPWLTPQNPVSKIGGLWLLDLKTLQSRQILPAQVAWMNDYYPRWKSDNELIVSFHCRKDTAITTWLIDLNGRRFKQLTYKGMQLIR